MVEDSSYIYFFPFIFAALCIFVVSQYTLARHKARGAWYLFFACLAASFWSASEGMLYLDFSLESKIWLTKCQFFGIAPILPLLLLFVLAIFEKRVRKFDALRGIFIAIMALIFILVWTNPLHNQMYTGYYSIESSAIQMLGLNHGLLWWLVLAYHYALVAVISVMLIKYAYIRTGFERSQALVILVAVASVWIANAIYITGHSPVPNMDISPIAFSLVAGSMAWGFFRHNLLDILPVAKTEVFKGMDDAVLVFDENNRLVDFNTAAEAIIKTKVSEIRSGQTQKIFAQYPVLKNILENRRHSEVTIRVDGQRTIYDVRVSKLVGRHRQTIGRIMALRDVTARKRAVEAILESEEKYKFLAENMGDIVWTLDTAFQITYLSPSIEKVLGYTPAEYKTLKLEKMMPPESIENIKRLYREELQPNDPENSASDQPHTVEVEYYHQNGTVVWLENKVQALKGATGQTLGLYGVSRDITKRKQAEEDTIRANMS